MISFPRSLIDHSELRRDWLTAHQGGINTKTYFSQERKGGRRRSLVGYFQKLFPGFWLVMVTLLYFLVIGLSSQGSSDSHRPQCSSQERRTVRVSLMKAGDIIYSIWLSTWVDAIPYYDRLKADGSQNCITIIPGQDDNTARNGSIPDFSRIFYII